MSIYEIKVHTEEGDADNGYYKSIICLTKEDLLFYLDVCNQLFKINMHVGDSVELQTLIEVIKSSYQRHPNISDDVKDEWIMEDDQYGDIYFELCETILGVPDEFYLANHENYCRCITKVEVYEMPELPKCISNNILRPGGSELEHEITRSITI